MDHLKGRFDVFRQVEIGGRAVVVCTRIGDFFAPPLLRFVHLFKFWSQESCRSDNGGAKPGTRVTRRGVGGNLFVVEAYNALVAICMRRDASATESELIGALKAGSSPPSD